jgi:hypothetical protein
MAARQTTEAEQAIWQQDRQYGSRTGNIAAEQAWKDRQQTGNMAAKQGIWQQTGTMAAEQAWKDMQQDTQRQYGRHKVM